MEQKDYTMEIVKQLLREPCHVRGLAQRLSTNHMMVYRIVKKLMEGNVLDYRKNGRNTVYFLKGTTEAKSYAFMCELYKLLLLIAKHPDLRPVIEKIQADGRIKLAVVFGSYAKSLAKPDSDVDIYIETVKDEIKRDIQLVDSRVSVKTGRYDRQNLLIKEIEKSHVIIKGVEEFYERSGLLA